MGAFAALFAVAATASAAGAATTELPVSAYGYHGGTTLTGTNPRFDLYVPDYPGARKMDVRFALSFPSIVDSNATVLVRVDGAPIASATVGALQRAGGVATGTFDRFHGKGKMLDVSVEAHLAVVSKPCPQFDPHALWMRVGPESRITIARDDAKPTTVNAFFQTYDDAYAIELAQGAPDSDRLSALALGYWIHQVERWRRASATFLQPAKAPQRRIVAGEFSRDLEVRDGTLYVTPRGIDLLIAQRAPAVTVKPDEAGFANVEAAPARSPVTLDALGIGTRTQQGAGELTFPTGFTLGTFGGLPHGLHFHVDLSHGAYAAGHAAVNVTLNGAVINGFLLSRAGGTQHYDVPIDDRRLGAANQLNVVVDYVPQDCAHAGVAVSLLGSSSFGWAGVAGYPPTIGEFFNESGGKLGVAVSDPKFDSDAFVLLDRLGQLDPHVGSIVASRYNGTSLTGVNAAIYVTSPEDLKEVPLSWDPATGELRLSNDAGKTVFTTQPGQAYGQIRALGGRVPSLVATYTKSDSPQVLQTVANLSASQLSAARSDTLLFDARGIVYESSAKTVISRREPPSVLRTSWPLFVAFGLVIVLALVLIARRARRVS